MRQIESITAAWAARFNARDAVGVAALYDIDAVLWGTFAHDIITAPEGIRKYFDAACASEPALTMTFDEQLIRPCGDLMLNAGSYTLHFTRDGKSQLLPLRFSMVLRQRCDIWLIVDHHSSTRPA